MTEKTTYNPMSNEFKEEAKILGLTGNQLTVKYKAEGKFLEKEKGDKKNKVDKKEKDTYNPISDEFKEEANRLTGHQLTVKYKREGKYLEKSACKYRKCTTSRINESYNSTNTCDKTTTVGFSWRKCGNELIPGKAHKEADKYGRETEKWLCPKCHRKYNKCRYKHGHNNNPNIKKSLSNIRTVNRKISAKMAKYGIGDDLLYVISHDDIENIIIMEEERKRHNKCNIKYQKKKTDCRNGNLDPNSSAGKGYISEILVAKFLGIKTCFDLTGNFNYPRYDMFEHEDWGVINVKGSIPTHKGNMSYLTFNTCRNTRPDFFFCIGYDENRKHVESVHIIPNEHYVCTIRGINIPCRGNSKWDKFKETEDEIKKWDDLFHTLKLEDCPVLRHGDMYTSKIYNKNGR